MNLSQHDDDCLVDIALEYHRAAACMNALRFYIKNTPYSQIQILTHQFFYSLFKRPTSHFAVRTAIDVFVAQGIFERRCLFDDGTFSDDIDVREVDFANEAGYLVHPETGDEITNYREFITEYWAVPERFDTKSNGTQNGDALMSNGDEKRPHEITGDDVKSDTAPVPAETVKPEPVADTPVTDKPANSPDKDDAAN